MSLFGSLFTGVSALTAQSQALGTISNNIANVNTVGYKRIESAFSSIVTSESRVGRYTPGSVLASRVNTQGQQGALQQTNSSTDISVTGSGFFVVQPGTDGLQDTLYTRAGSFSEDAQGFLRNTAGYYLMGWPLGTNGELPTAQADLSSLQPVDVAFLGGLTRPTTDGEIGLNLDSTQEQTAYPLATNQAADFTRALRVFDSLGAPQDIEFRFTKHTSPTARADTAVPAGGVDIDTILTSLPNIEDTETIDITVGAVTETFTITPTTTTQDLVDFVNNSTTLGPISLASLTENGQIRITAANLADNVTVVDGGVVVGGTGAATALGFVTTAAPAAPNIFPAGLASLENTPNPEGWWELDLYNAANNSLLSSGSINFNGNGTINAIEDIDGEIKVPLNGIVWGNGSEPQDIDISLRNVTQFAGEYNVVFSEQNGAELGLRTGIEVNDQGIVSARFSNGQTSDLFKLPLVTFTNPNGLDEKNGNAYTETNESGSFNLREAGQGGAGLVNSGALEASNVDLADEFAKMIIVQRAYSAGTKVISTSDEMTEELLRLR